MKNELRKLAKLLRERGEKRGKDKVVKCAQVAQAALGLELLRRKIGGQP
jgi:hypothetical protein